MVEAEASRTFGRKLSEMLERRLQHHEGANDVRLDKLAGTVDRAIHMALGGEVDHHIGIERLDSRPNRGRVADIGLEELVAV